MEQINSERDGEKIMAVASACLDFELGNINQESKRSLGSEK